MVWQRGRGTRVHRAGTGKGKYWEKEVEGRRQTSQTGIGTRMERAGRRLWSVGKGGGGEHTHGGTEEAGGEPDRAD